MKTFLCSARAWLWLLALGLVACGGGSQIEPFRPDQIIVLGDETAVLTADGKNFSINGLDANNAIACTQQAIWSHQLAANLGFVLDRCNPSGSTVTTVTRGAPGARAADLAAQIDAQLAAGPVGPKSLFVVMVGLNDIIDQFENFAGAKDCDPDTDRRTPLEVELRARGEQVAAQINRLAAANARIVVSTVHDVGLTPYALSRGAGPLLTCLTSAFNTGLRVSVLQDGRFIGLVLADDQTLAMVKSPGSFGLSNLTEPACTVALPDCTTATLAAGGSTATHLWADDRHFGPVMHNQLALLAEARAHNNPF
jgi:phospholipase/lecithinase/hemolysin